VPSNYLKTHPHYRAMKRRAALRKAEKAKADNGQRLVPFRNNNLGAWAVLIRTKSLLFWLGQAAFSLFFYVS
jgi:hypothetical protein